MWAQVFWGGADGVVMANTIKHTGPQSRASREASASISLDPTAADEARLSPRIEALRKLIASGQYQVSPRYLAYRIMRTAGVRPE
jgi:anti-sigma28 factor (negative regulator of flagellin synthesis)